MFSFSIPREEFARSLMMSGEEVAAPMNAESRAGFFCHLFSPLLGWAVELPGFGNPQGQSSAGIIGEDLGSFFGLTQDTENMSVGGETSVQ